MRGVADGDIAGAFKGGGDETGARPVGEDPSAFHAAAHDEHDAGASVVCTDADVLGDTTAKFGHDHDMDATQVAAEVTVKRGEAASKPGHKASC